MYIIRATTPSFIFKLPFDTSTVKELLITFSQCGRKILNKKDADVVFDEDKIKFVLTQNETNLFNKGPAQIQCRVTKTNNGVYASSVIDCVVMEVLNDSIMNEDEEYEGEDVPISGFYHIGDRHIDVDFGNMYDTTGFVLKGEYKPTTTYKPGEVVSYRNSSYVAKKKTIDIVPTNKEYWQLVATGFMEMGDYNAETTYYINDVVTDPLTHNSYVAKQVTTGNPLTDEEYWQLFVKSGKDGLTTAIKIRDQIYTHEDGIISLPDEALDCRIDKDFTTRVTVGQLPKNTPITADMTLKDILYAILYGQDTPVLTFDIYYYEGVTLPDNISDVWSHEMADEDITTVGIHHIYTGGFKGYIGVAFDKQLGNLSHVYENDLYQFDLIEDMEKTEVVYNGKEYNMYLFTVRAAIGADKYDYLFVL